MGEEYEEMVSPGASLSAAERTATKSSAATMARKLASTLAGRLNNLADGLAMSAKLEGEIAEELAGDPQFAMTHRRTSIGLQSEADDIRAVIEQRSDLLEALKAANAAIDAFWNADPRNREPEIKTLCEAQQRSFAAISKATGEQP